MGNEIVVSQQAEQFLPVMSIAVAVQRRAAIVEFTRQIMVRDVDYGVVPGTGSKPSLLKPGAEKLCTLFGLAPLFVPVETIQDWNGKDYDGEAFFLYRYRCELYRNGVMVGAGIGSCNSRESKYRYRKADRTCPHCGQPAIIKGKEQYGGGWVCFKNKGGCGAKFGDNDPAIVNQPMGKVINPDPADIVNTLDKMAQKRALVAATLIAVNASEFFTQDIEDMATGGYVDAIYTTVTEVTQSQPQPAKLAPPPAVTEVTQSPADDAAAAAIIGTWQTPQDAYEWAISIGACKSHQHARNAFERAVKENGGHFRKENAAAVYAAFYHDRIRAAAERAQQEPDIAKPLTIDMAAIDEVNPAPDLFA